MFRAASGFKAQYQDMTLRIAADFDEWRILLQDAHSTINGGRQFTEAKAKEYAEAMAASYLTERRHEQVSGPVELNWLPLEPEEWLNWRP